MAMHGKYVSKIFLGIVLPEFGNLQKEQQLSHSLPLAVSVRRARITS